MTANSSWSHLTRPINRERSTPWIAGIGPCSTISTKAYRCASFSRERGPGALRRITSGEGTRRITNMALQSQAIWGSVERADKGKRIERKKAMDLKESEVAAWLAKACIRHSGRALPLLSIGSSCLSIRLFSAPRLPTSSPNLKHLKCGWIVPAIR